MHCEIWDWCILGFVQQVRFTWRFPSCEICPSTIKVMMTEDDIHKNIWISYELVSTFSDEAGKSFVNVLSHPQNGRDFADDTFRCIFMIENFCISIKIPLKFVSRVPRSPIDNNPTLVEIMAWRRIGDITFSEPMLTRFTDAYMRQWGWGGVGGGGWVVVKKSPSNIFQWSHWFLHKT